MLSPRENIIRFFKKEDYEYPPTNDDMLRFLPEIIPCFISRGLVLQQKPYTGELGGKDFFGVDWYYDPVARGSMERKPLMSDLEELENWREIVKFPDLSKVDWEGCAAENAEYLKTDKIVNTTIYSGFFERLISFVGFENAAMALVDEELAETVGELFDRLAEFYIEFIHYMHDYFNVELITLHDDWGTQISTMFSVETHTEMILPYVKKVIDGAHSIGVFVEQHSCGKIDALIPNIIASGADTWRGQNITDKKTLVERYGSQFRFGVELVPGTAKKDSDEAVMAQIGKTIDEYRDRHVWYGFPRGLTPAQIELAKSIMYR